LPLSKDEFNNEKEEAFKDSIASAAGVDVLKIVITSIEPATIRRRRLLAEGIDIDIEVQAEDAITAESIRGSLTPEIINEQLRSAGLPEAQVLSAPAVQTITKSTRSPNAESNSITIIIASVASLAGVSLVTAAIVLRRRAMTKAGLKATGMNQSLLPHQPNIMMPDMDESPMSQLAHARRAKLQQASSFSDITVVDVEEIDNLSAAGSQDIGFVQSPAEPGRLPQQDKTNIAKMIKNMRMKGQLDAVNADAHLGFHTKPREIQISACKVSTTKQNPRMFMLPEPVAQWDADKDPAVVTSGGVAARQNEQL